MTGNEGQGCLASLASFLLGKRSQDQAEAAPEDLPYRLRDDFLSPAELSFYKVLLLATRDQFAVCAKVNLLDVFFVARPHENQGFRNKISSKHVDFLLCHPETLRPLVGFELDDPSHRKADRQERDTFVESVFEAAGLPLLRFPVRSVYDVRALAESVARHTGTAVPGTGEIPAELAAPAQTAPGVPTCPKCGVPMILRTASRGEHQGESFYGCPNYPRCRETRGATQ
jgi:hypothetical protein